MEPWQLTAELILDGKAALGEGPVWDHRSGRLLWVDIEGMRIHHYDPVQGTDRSIQLDQRVGAAVPRAEGDGLVLALEHGFHLLDPATERLTKIADPEAGLLENRFNDGKCDEAGRFWAGTMNRMSSGPTGALYCLETDGSLRKAIDGVVCSNGLGWSPDGRTMYYIDSPTKQVVAYDYEPAAGAISNRRTVVTIPEGEGVPDGMAVDREGMLWVAQWGGWRVSCWNPQTGERLGFVRVPAAQTTSCAFGGPDWDELYITTARTGLSEEQLAQQPHAGGLFRVKTGVKGRPACFYGG
ncbi:SMP-30/gluconolactonase/LRE family protein [Paenibacillus tyrfis]|uniref:SMP-30/gluconolactonase/LRE family protein n=1 Tax=Paenibacillus tyrfis TaxID=1501230 RepID=UPI00209FB90B|nr:SMP-30/gluconolactonase/LRE family protein [Paenibacillus tyrfis]MCP1310124.1 SMP-30/gluconolactonase/LRE family protein [Paenibacillus tyrfis]